MTGWSLSHSPIICKISSKSVNNFFSYPAVRQTDRQTDSFIGGEVDVAKLHDVTTTASLADVLSTMIVAGE